MTGNNHGSQDSVYRIPDLAFSAMAFLFRIRDRIHPPEKKLSSFGIRRGMTVVDYGCGPGGYLESASRLVGPEGIVYAVDIHERAIESVSQRITTTGQKTIIPILAEGYNSGLATGSADLVYALDMFHMVPDTAAFLKELLRITKPDGILIIDDGHQPRDRTRQLISGSELWEIISEEREFLRCNPKHREEQKGRI
ncbi:MAG: class I SAM-dependent methyltransferase [Methanocalculus sp.]|uniref:class I SAM-dependent methyltransferase n=1 Tax=Methanocalculus sp. TaxID=2004547 RepID=UPI0027239661|nr:class I SAM-dependent methyltransferase [Methanocalculus sp.]MDO9538565.1 class I SAM-dependent methyltransferase [Methanocalculus sp.]